MAYNPSCFTTQIAGMSQISVQLPGGSLTQVGIAQDAVSIQERIFTVDTYSDANGGPQGPPTDRHYLGAMHVISFVLSTYTLATVQLLEQYAVNATRGTILQSEIGTSMFRTAPMRLLIENQTAAFNRNYPTTNIFEPVQFSQGSKPSEYAFTFSAYRSPCSVAKPNVLFDQDVA